MQNHKARIERLYALAEKLGRVCGQAHNLADDLNAKIANRRAATRSMNSPKAPSRSRSRRG